MTTIQLAGTPFRDGAPRLRMTSRGRRVLIALVVIPMLVVIAALALNGGKATAANEPVKLTYVSVQQGESLWQLAGQIAPSADPRDVINDIVSLNHLGSAEIVAGQRLAIPVQYAAQVSNN